MKSKTKSRSTNVEVGGTNLRPKTPDPTMRMDEGGDGNVDCMVKLSINQEACQSHCVV